METILTKWKIKPSLKYDVCCFLNILTADDFYLTYYQEVYDEFKPKLTLEVTEALSCLKKKMKDDNGIIIANLCLYYSAVEDSTI